MHKSYSLLFTFYQIYFNIFQCHGWLMLGSHFLITIFTYKFYIFHDIVQHRDILQDVHKEIIRRQRTVTGRWKNVNRKLALAVAPCHLVARKSCSFLTSFLSIRLFLCSWIADRWQMERRRSSTIHSTGYNCSTTDWLLPSGLLCKLYTACLYPFVSSRPSSHIL